MAPRRTSEEWITVAAISKRIAHLFVEGESDARILAHLFGYPANVDFRAASEVEPGPDLATSFCGGYRLRLMRLATAASNGQTLHNLRCLIDADFAVLFEDAKRLDVLRKTDFANLPSYTMTEEWLRGFLSKGFGYILEEGCWDFIKQTLTFAFLARFISATLDSANAAPSVSDFVRTRNGKFEFDNSGYLRRFFQFPTRKAVDISKQISEMEQWLCLDVRHVVNSNDVFDLLYQVLRGSKKISGSYPRDAVRSAYLAAFNEPVDDYPVLADLKSWIRTFSDEYSTF